MRMYFTQKKRGVIIRRSKVASRCAETSSKGWFETMSVVNITELPLPALHHHHRCFTHGLQYPMWMLLVVAAAAAGVHGAISHNNPGPD